MYRRRERTQTPAGPKIYFPAQLKRSFRDEAIRRDSVEALADERGGEGATIVPVWIDKRGKCFDERGERMPGMWLGGWRAGGGRSGRVC